MEGVDDPVSCVNKHKIYLTWTSRAYTHDSSEKSQFNKFLIQKQLERAMTCNKDPSAMTWIVHDAVAITWYKS